MEVTIRPLRLFSRFWRRPIGLASLKSASPATLIEEANVELVHKFNKDIHAGGAVPVFRRALLFPSRVALQDDFGIYTYAGLHQAASALSKDIAAQLVGDSERTITYMCSNDASHIIVQWAIWMTGNIAVPLTSLHPPDMLKYFMQDSMASLVVCTQEYENLLRPISLDVGLPLLTTTRDNEITAQLYQPNSTFLNPKLEDSLADIGKTNDWYGSREAMLIYTSGTTSKPKGVVWTHSMLQSQIASLHSAWQYSSRDVVLHALPLNHIHGQLNSMLASLAAGARIRMLSKFVSHIVWARLLGMGEREESKVTVFHGVPAMYAKLAHDYDKMFGNTRTGDYVKTTLANRMRLMCAGSAPLPETLFKKWEELSGIRLLERYGMTECGMALSNPFDPVEDRTVGCVGVPLPGMRARIAAANDEGQLEPLVTVEAPQINNEISLERLFASTKDFFSVDGGDWQEPTVKVHKKTEDGVYQGELLLKGPGVFSRYWNRAPTLGSSDWTSDEWFRTGDTVSFSEGRFRILGRTSSDIIKTSGYKVSALQVESAILEHPDVADAAVIGVDNEDYGEIVAAVVTTKDNKKLILQELKTTAGKKLAPYQLPKILLVVNEIPRNIMGKLDKKLIKERFGKDLNFKK